jgi:ABC exporter DevB family membrane fusion protein
MTPNSKTSASIALALVLSVAGASLLLNGGSRAVSAPDRTRALPKRVAGLGVVEPETGLVDLAPLTPGGIAEIYVHEGDRVKKGELLAELVNEDLKAKVAQAEAQLAIKQADRRRIRTGNRPEDIQKAEAQLREEESSLKLLELQLARRQYLASKGDISLDALNTATSSRDASRQRRQAALKNLELLRNGSRQEDIDAAEADVRLAQEQLAEARANLAKTYVYATLDGKVLRRYLEPGEVVIGETISPIVQIGDTEHLTVRTQIDEDDIAPLRLGEIAEISAAGLGGRKFKGKVTLISPRLGAKTVTSNSPTEKRDARVLEVIVTLDAGVDLPVNMRVDVVIDTAAGAAAAVSEGNSAGVLAELRL